MNGRLEQVTPRQFAVLLVGHFQRSEHARHAHRTPAYLGLRKRYRLAISPQEHARVGPCRGRFATIKGLNLLAIPIQNESTATDATGLRLDQRKHRLHGDRRINRRPALAQHLLPGSGCQRVGRCGHMASGVYREHV